MTDTVSSARVHVSGWRAVLDLIHVHHCYELCLVDQLGNGYQQHPTSIELDDAVITLMLRYASHI